VKIYFLDTSFIIDLIKKQKIALEIHKRIKGFEVTSSVCIYELAKYSNIDVYPLFKDKNIILLDIDDAIRAGEINRELSKEGIFIGEIDTLIAGIVKNRNLILVTRDQHFKKVPDIKTIFYEI